MRRREEVLVLKLNADSLVAKSVREDSKNGVAGQGNVVYATESKVVHVDERNEQSGYDETKRH